MRELLTVLTVLLLHGVIVFGQTLDEGENSIARQPKLGLLGSPTNVISQLAQDLFSRSTASSQVLSLNITNLVILLVIKALIFGAGSLGFGGSDALGRSIDHGSTENSLAEESLLSQNEILLMLGYLKGDLSQNYGCLNFAACTDPRKAKQYLMAGNVINKGVNLLNISPDASKYEKLLSDAEEAANFGNKGYDCSIRYSC